MIPQMREEQKIRIYQYVHVCVAVIVWLMAMMLWQLLGTNYSTVHLPPSLYH